MKIQPDITVLLPVYNEEENVMPVYAAVTGILKSLSGITYEVVFADDGSTDRTLSKIKMLAAEHEDVFFISFSRNFGKDHALMAGLQHCRGKAVITMDADLQHPPALIPEFIEHWKKGFDVVYAYREEKNQHAGFMNQLFSRFFYTLINKLSDVQLENGISDYRLIDRKVTDVLINMKEDNPFFRGLLKWVGFKQMPVPYEPAERQNGVTKYNMKALLKLAIHSITSFSTKPLTYAIYVGFFFSLASVLYVPYALYSYFTDVSISGWASTIVTIAFFGGLQLMIMGIIGIYLGKVFIQAKGRPSFIIAESNFK